MSSTWPASASLCAAPLMMPSWSRSHCTAAPVTAIDPSSAKMAGSAPNLKHTVVSRPLVERTMSVPVFSSRKLPVP